MGIMGGTAIIPEDWKEYIGDKIIQICINASYRACNPGTCTKLTEWVMQTIPTVLFGHEIYMEYTDGETEFDKNWALEYKCAYDEHPTKVFDYSPYSYVNKNCMCGDVTVEFEGEPKRKIGEPLKFKYTVRNTLLESYNADVNIFLPEGWVAEYDRSIFILKRTRHSDRFVTYEVTVTAWENISSKNKLILSISSPARAIEYAIPVNILG